VVLRTLLAGAVIAPLTLLLGLPVLLVGPVDRSGRGVHALVRLWARLVLAILGVRVAVSGLGNAPSGPAVWAANHSSALDIPILFGYLPVDFRIIHKRSLYVVPVVGWALFLGGHIAIDRSNPFRARRSLERAAARVRGGTSVAVFPEGTRNRGPQVGLFKRGSFVLALNAQVPVVPVSLVGVRERAPRGLLRLRPGAVTVRIQPALETAGRRTEEGETLAAEVRRLVVLACEEAE
jgi:1-acyl-sn-glycerol-3-phosphate acyltransferase